MGWSCGLVLIPVFAFALFATAVSAFLWAGANVFAAEYVSSWPFGHRVLACVGLNAGPLGLSCFLNPQLLPQLLPPQLLPWFSNKRRAEAVSAVLLAGANVMAAAYVSSWPFWHRVLACVGFNAGPLGLSCFLWFSNKRRAEAEEEERWQQRIDALKKTS